MKCGPPMATFIGSRHLSKICLKLAPTFSKIIRQTITCLDLLVLVALHCTYPKDYEGPEGKGVNPEVLQFLSRSLLRALAAQMIGSRPLSRLTTRDDGILIISRRQYCTDHCCLLLLLRLHVTIVSIRCVYVHLVHENRDPQLYFL